MVAKQERRNWLRLDKVFPVEVEGPESAIIRCVARNISAGGIFLEARQLVSLGSPVRIHFTLPGGCGGINARGEVKNHYYLNYRGAEGQRSVCGMGVRFLDFEDDGLARLHRAFATAQPMH